MDEQMIADAIERNVTWQTGEVFKGNRQCVNYLEVATAAHSVIAGKVAELGEALEALRSELEHERASRMHWQVRAALAPYPERRSE